MTPKKKTAVRTLVGTISGYECGDNCYLKVTDKNGKEHTGLCTARPICTTWNADTEMPDNYKGKKVRITVGKAPRYDGSGKVVDRYDAFTKIQFLAETKSSFAGTYKSGSYGSLIIKEIGTTDPKAFNFKIHLETKYCGGGIEGTANWINDNTASSKTKNDLYDASNENDAPYCELTFIFTGKKVLVKEENLFGCTNFHGVRGCGFDGETFIKR